MLFIRILVLCVAANAVAAEKADMRLAFVDSMTGEEVPNVTAEFSSEGAETLIRASGPDGRMILYGCTSDQMAVRAVSPGYVPKRWTGRCSEDEDWTVVTLTPIRVVSMLELITDGEEFYDQAVLTCGFFAPRPPHGAYLAPSKALWEHGTIRDNIRVVMTKKFESELAKDGERYLCIEGFFRRSKDLGGPKGYLDTMLSE